MAKRLLRHAGCLSAEVSYLSMLVRWSTEEGGFFIIFFFYISTHYWRRISMLSWVISCFSKTVLLSWLISGAHQALGRPICLLLQSRRASRRCDVPNINLFSPVAFSNTMITGSDWGFFRPNISSESFCLMHSGFLPELTDLKVLQLQHPLKGVPQIYHWLYCLFLTWSYFICWYLTMPDT